MKDIIIVGAGGFAREVAWLIEEINLKNQEWNLIGFFDENNNEAETLNGYRLLNKSDLANQIQSYLVVAIGDSETRKKVVNRYSSFKFATLIHPDVSISFTNSVGEGSIICKGNIITVNVDIGKHVIVNIDSTIGHDAVLEDYVTILPSVNISGYVKIKECSNVGTGTQIIQEKTIGRNSIIGAGSVVVKDINDYVVAVGIPAREIKNRRDV
jgi:sugar O-acyltransferase (sialic acid O-acetyltransferase NeuD family)